jgi:hypothetical protein
MARAANLKGMVARDGGVLDYERPIQSSDKQNAAVQDPIAGKGHAADDVGAAGQISTIHNSPADPR